MIDHPMVPCSALAETLTIEKLVYGGDGLARLDGKVIFTPYVLPGEAVQADIDAIFGEPWQYRNRAQLHIEDGAVGYFEHGSHTLCAIDRCPIVSPVLNG